MRDHADRDVVLVTLDSCRYDTAVQAVTPNLDRLGPLLQAETSGTFTLPAHVAFFSGMTPRPLDGEHDLAGQQYRSIWRSTAARPSTAATAVPFTGPMLMDHYSRSGFKVIGAGGVTFFDPKEPGNWLPSLFDTFYYFGRTNATAADTRVRYREESLTLAHPEILADDARAAKRFFLFINCPSTHIPYTTPNTRLTNRTRALLERLYRLHDSKQVTPDAFAPDEVASLHSMQVRALEWADQQLGILFDRLADREPLVVLCADHGEEFGDDGRYGHGHPHPSVTTVPLWSGILRQEQP
ncbi:sulfatase-like hydrolase/transferase [Myceligenerans crystallogenes]|uniref:STM4013/SEN3800 family hydrolase n=1 Tax=Myceligenerans crystallogenes TaxID=316335 RepID=A0ABN2NBW8_9MICO